MSKPKKRVDLRDGLNQTLDARRVGPLISESIRACAMLHAVGALYPEARGVREVNRSLHRAISRLVEHVDAVLITGAEK